MALFTPPNVGGGIRDFWNYIRVDRPHRWPAMLLSVTIPALVIYFMARSVEPPPEKRSIIYFQSWRADRSDFDVRRDWLNRALAENEQNRQRRRNYGSVARVVGQPYDEAGAMREFDEARATIQQALRDLDAAQAAGRPLPPLPRAEENATRPAPAPAQPPR